MCVDLESTAKHARRIGLKHRFLWNRERSGERMMRENVRGRIHVPTALAAVEAGVIDAIDPETLVFATRLPRIPHLPKFGAVVSTDEISAFEAHRRAEEEQARQRWLEQNPYALAVA